MTGPQFTILLVIGTASAFQLGWSMRGDVIYGELLRLTALKADPKACVKKKPLARFYKI